MISLLFTFLYESLGTNHQRSRCQQPIMFHNSTLNQDQGMEIDEESNEHFNSILKYHECCFMWAFLIAGILTVEITIKTYFKTLWNKSHLHDMTRGKKCFVPERKGPER